MKAKTVVLGCLIGVVALAMGYEYSQAGPKAEEAAPKIGVVSVLKIFRDCQRNIRYRARAAAERDKVEADLKKLSKEIEAQEAGLKALKPESSDYLAQRKELWEKRAKLEAQQKFHNEQTGLRDYRWTRELYRDVLRITLELAEEKGLDLVLEKDEIDNIALSVSELTRTISTNKVLYSGGCVNITDEVLARLDKEEPKLKK